MSLDARLQDVLDDLEQQADGLWATERDTEVAELGQAEYAAVDVASRLHASLGNEVTVWTVTGQRVEGALARTGTDFCLVRTTHDDWLVPQPSITRVEGLSTRSVAEAARSVLGRLSMRSVLRRLAGDGREVVVHQGGAGDRQRCEGRIVRVGKDFLELDRGPRSPCSLVPTAAIALVQVRP